MTIVRVEPIDAAGALPESVARIARLLDSGGVIACPTETVYGLSADYLCVEAAGRIRGIKGRDAPRPFLLLVPGRDWMDRLALRGPWTEPVRRITEAFWPGPVTLVVPAIPGLPPHATGPGGTVALRESSDPFVRALLAARPRPLLSTSANRAGDPPAHDLQALRACFDAGAGQVDAVVDAGRRDGRPSTLVSVTGGEIRILRPGPIGKAEIEAAARS